MKYCYGDILVRKEPECEEKLLILVVNWISPCGDVWCEMLYSDNDLSYELPKDIKVLDEFYKKVGEL